MPALTVLPGFDFSLETWVQVLNPSVVFSFIVKENDPALKASSHQIWDSYTKQMHHKILNEVKQTRSHKVKNITIQLFVFCVVWRLFFVLWFVFRLLGFFLLFVWPIQITNMSLSSYWHKNVDIQQIKIIQFFLFWVFFFCFCFLFCLFCFSFLH